MKTNVQHSKPTSTTIGKLLGALSATTLFVLGAVGVADASTGAPVTDYASYPAALPAGCPSGADALHGLSFDNGRGASAASLSDLDVRHGDTVTMSWSGFAAGCTNPDGSPAITVGLAAYDNPTLAFDATVDQELQDGWTACGTDGDACAKNGSGRYHLSVTLPSTAVCNVQLDSFLGLPLAVVGPNGSFYSDWVRGHGTNRLVSAANFGLETCLPPTTTTTAAPLTTATEAPTVTTAPEVTTTTAVEVETTTPEVTTTTTAPAVVTTVAPAAAPVVVSAPSEIPGPAAAPATATAPETKVLAEQVTAPAVTTLPFTGTDTLQTLRIAAWVGLAGAATMLLAGGLRRRRHVES